MSQNGPAPRGTATERCTVVCVGGLACTSSVRKRAAAISAHVLNRTDAATSMPHTVSAGGFSPGPTGVDIWTPIPCSSSCSSYCSWAAAASITTGVASESPSRLAPLRHAERPRLYRPPARLTCLPTRKTSALLKRGSPSRTAVRRSSDGPRVPVRHRTRHRWSHEDNGK